MKTIQAIDAKTLKKWLDQNEAVLIDVRELQEYEAGYIATAIHIPLGSISNEKLPPLGNKKLIVHCGIGKRSFMACEKLLRENPHLNIYNLEGGIVAWKKEGFPVKKLSTHSINLDRQILISIGGIVLLGIILGYFIHPAFLLLPAFVSVLALYVGLRASSLLVMILAIMPWNKRK